MARPIKKSVYERIEEKKLQVTLTEEALSKLNDELKVLYEEKDNLEMRQLFAQMKANNFDINQALAMLSKKEDKTTKQTTKKEDNTPTNDKEPKKESK